MPSKKNTPYDVDSWVQHNQSVEELTQQQQSDSDLSAGASSEYIIVKLTDIIKHLQCPICLGIIRRTRTVMECLHRFCRECIHKSMRLGKNECPVCRTHCASRRSLRDDPTYDALITALYPHMDKYDEEEEWAFDEENRAPSMQIQASIAQTVQQQSEELEKKHSSARTTAAAYARRSKRANEQQGSAVVHTNDHDRGKNSSCADEMVTEVKPKRSKRLEGSRFPQISLTEGSADGGDENVPEVNRHSLGASAGHVGIHEMLALGRGGIGSRNGQRRAQNDVLEIHLTLVPLKEERIPSLQCLQICCSPTVSIAHLCQYVGLKTDVGAEEVEILLVKGLYSEFDPTVTSTVSISERTVDACKDKLHILEEHEMLSDILEEHETLSQLQAKYSVNRRDLVFAYRKKLSASTSFI